MTSGPALPSNGGPPPLSFSFPKSALQQLSAPATAALAPSPTASSSPLPAPSTPSTRPASDSAAASSSPSLPSSSSAFAPGPIRLGRSARALLVAPNGALFPVVGDEAAVGTKAGRCQVVLCGCSELSAVHVVFSFERLLQRWQVQVLGRTGASLQGRHLFPSSLRHDLPASAALLFPCSNASHVHLVQFCLPQHGKRGSSSSVSALRLAEEANLNRPEWSDAEQLRFQRSFMSFGVHGLEQVKRAGYMTKKNALQLRNYATAFLLECRKQLTDDSERLYVDTVLDKEGWTLTHTEPSLSKWRKLQSNASVWIKRLRTIQLLEDLVVTAAAQDVDVLSLLPKASLRLNATTAPAPWWDNSHDRLLLHAVYEHGWCRYDVLKADRKYAFLIPQTWSSRVKEINEHRDSKEQRGRRKTKAGAGEDDDGADDVDDEEEDEREDAAAGEAGEKKDGDDILKLAAAGASSGPAAVMIDVNDNVYGITFPNADVLTKRMRRLVENQRKTWWRKKGGPEQREVPVRIRQKKRTAEGDQPQSEEGREGGQQSLKRRRGAGDEERRVWSPSAVHAVVDAVMSLGLEKDNFHRLRWSKVLDYCAHTHSLQISAEEEGQVEQVLLHCLEDHFMQMHSPALSSLIVFGLPVVQPPSLISPADGETLSSRLLFFAKLRSRVLVQSPFTIRTLIDTHHPPLPASPLPPWYSPGQHDLLLLLGVSKWGVSAKAWQRMVDDKELGWKDVAGGRQGQGGGGRKGGGGSVKMEEEKKVDDAADQEIQAIIQQEKEDMEEPALPPAVKPEPLRSSSSLAVSVLHYEALLQRAMDLVDALYPISPVQAPLSTTFSALCPLVPAESSSARRKREAAVQEELAGARRTSSRRAKRVMKEVSIYQVTSGELSHSAVSFVPSLTRYTTYLFSHTSPMEASVTPFDVNPLSVTAVSASHPVWKPLVRHLKTSLTPAQPSSSSIYACGDRRDEHRLLSPLHTTYRAYLHHGQLTLPLWLPGGLTVHSLGSLDGRSQALDERDGERGVWLAPAGYRAVRVHQSIVDPNRMARYLCEVVDVDPASVGLPAPTLPASSPLLPSTTLLFRLTCSDCPDAPLYSSSPHALWLAVSNLIFDMTDAPLASRRNGGSNGWERFGLTHPLVRWMIERSGGVELCPAYRRQGPITVQLYSTEEDPKSEDGVEAMVP